MKLSRFSLFAGAAIGAFAATVPVQAQDPMLGQVTAFGFNFCPRGWASADGQFLPISQNQALYALYGTTYGGNGTTTFAIPDLRGRRSIGDGNSPTAGNYVLGQKAGSTSFTLSVPQLPAHTHTGTIGASTTAADSNIPVRNSFAASTGTNAYLDGNPAANNMHPDLVRMDNTGGSASVNKVSPYVAINWCVALQGVFPSRS